MMPHRATALTVAMLASLSMSACAFKTDGPPPDPQIAKLQQQLDASRGISIEEVEHSFIPGSEENQYSVAVSWPKGRPVLISITLPNTSVATYDGRTTNSFTLDCRDRRIKYDFKVISPVAGSRILNDFTVDRPCLTDKTIVGTATLGDLPRELDGRLIMKRGSKLLVRDKDLKLTIRSLIIEGHATIQTAETSRESKLRDSIGTRVPEISIRANEARGLLQFELNGINGPPVPDLAAAIDSSLNGSSGTNGTVREECGEDRRTRTGETVPRVCRSVCDIHPGNGNNGRQPMDTQKDGTKVVKKGAKGNPGIAGIGTSKVNLQISKADNFDIRIRFNPGRASAPGAGSLPAGGLGGKPGLNPGGLCRNASAGDPGDAGQIGDSGAAKEDGSCEVISISSSLNGKIKAEDADPTLPCASLPAIIQVRDPID